MRNLGSAVGAAIRLVRHDRNLSQSELAASLSVLADCAISQSYVSKIEAGAVHASWRRLSAFSRCLGCLASEIVLLAEQLLMGGRPSDLSIPPKR